MNFDNLDLQMRQFELSLDQTIDDNIYIVTRLDGRGFTKLTKDTLNFERPFDIRFNEIMCKTVSHLIQCGFNIRYGYTQSDEISLLFEPGDQTFSRKTRKINTILAGEASAIFSLELKQPAIFDCRICPLPGKQNVTDYFRWRQSDAQRNALTAYCYWTLRDEGNGPNKASKMIDGLTRDQKIQLLLERNIDFKTCPDWQRNGSGFIWEEYKKQGTNPLTQTTETAIRRRVKRLEKLPVDQNYEKFLRDLLKTF